MSLQIRLVKEICGSRRTNDKAEEDFAKIKVFLLSISFEQERQLSVGYSGILRTHWMQNYLIVLFRTLSNPTYENNCAL